MHKSAKLYFSIIFRQIYCTAAAFFHDIFEFKLLQEFGDTHINSLFNNRFLAFFKIFVKDILPYDRLEISFTFRLRRCLITVNDSFIFFKIRLSFSRKLFISLSRFGFFGVISGYLEQI